jgi:hypothetical protein
MRRPVGYGLLGIGVLAAASLALTSPSRAEFTLGSGVFSSAVCTPSCTGNFSATDAAGAIDDTYAFTVSPGSSVLLHAASATNSSTTAGQIIFGFTLELLQGVPPVGVLLATAAPSLTFPGTQFTGSLEFPVGPGSYFLEVTGTHGADATTYSGSFSFTAVPAPVLGAGLPALVMACGGLLALARRRRQQVAA